MFTPALKLALFASAALFVVNTTTLAYADDDQSGSQQPEQSDECHVNVDTDSGKGGSQVKVCDHHAEVGVSGPIKDVDVQHPVGKGKAFIPQAGRDAQSVVSHAGHTIEDGAHWIGDRTGIHF